MTLLDDGESFAVETQGGGEYRLKLVGAILVLGWLLDAWGRERSQGDMLIVLLAVIAGLRTRQQKVDALAHLQGVVSRLANRLQRRLMAQQQRTWNVIRQL